MKIIMWYVTQYVVTLGIQTTALNENIISVLNFHNLFLILFLEFLGI